MLLFSWTAACGNEREHMCSVRWICSPTYVTPYQGGICVDIRKCTMEHWQMCHSKDYTRNRVCVYVHSLPTATEDRDPLCV